MVTFISAKTLREIHGIYERRTWLHSYRSDCSLILPPVPFYEFAKVLEEKLKCKKAFFSKYMDFFLDIYRLCWEPNNAADLVLGVDMGLPPILTGQYFLYEHLSKLAWFRLLTWKQRKEQLHPILGFMVWYLMMVWGFEKGKWFTRIKSKELENLLGLTQATLFKVPEI